MRGGAARLSFLMFFQHFATTWPLSKRRRTQRSIGWRTRCQSVIRERRRRAPDDPASQRSVTSGTAPEVSTDRSGPARDDGGRDLQYPSDVRCCIDGVPIAITLGEDWPRLPGWPSSERKCSLAPPSIAGADPVQARRVLVRDLPPLGRGTSCIISPTDGAGAGQSQPWCGYRSTT